MSANQMSNDIENEIYAFLKETKGGDAASLFVLDGQCGLTDFANVQEHLLSIIPISEFEDKWVLANDTFRTWCITMLPIEDVRDEWIFDEDREMFAGRKKDEKKVRTYLRDVNRNRRGVDRIARVDVSEESVLRKKKFEACECGCSRFIESCGRFFCGECGCQDIVNDHGSPILTSEIPVSESRTPSPPQISKQNTRLKSFLFFLRTWRGHGGHKANDSELALLREAFPDPAEMSYSRLKLWMYKKTGLNHLYAGIYSLMQELGRPRLNVDAVYDDILDAFHTGGYADEKSKMKNLGILTEILDKIGFEWERDDESSLAKGRHFF